MHESPETQAGSLAAGSSLEDLLSLPKGEEGMENGKERNMSGQPDEQLCGVAPGC